MGEKGICLLKANLWHAHNSLLIQQISLFWTLQSHCHLSKVTFTVMAGTGQHWLTWWSVMWQKMDATVVSLCAKKLWCVIMWCCSCESSPDPLVHIRSETVDSLDFTSRYTFDLILITRSYMFPVFSIMVTVKAELISFNIKFKNCCSLSASHDYKSIR